MSNGEDESNGVDPFTVEVFRNAFDAITHQMKVNLQRTAYNTIIYEAEDFTVGLFDTEGNTISIGLGLPMFIRGLSDAIKGKIAHWGLDGMRPGDILLTNDPYLMGSHLNHLIFTVPVFHEGEIVAFSSSMAHWPDVGGTLDRNTRDIYSEGVVFPFVKIYKEGVLDPELASIIRANVRAPERALGDFRAQIAAIRTGERRLSALLERYGAEAFRASVRQIFDQSEAAARRAVQAIPDGTYTAEAFLDNDGVTLDRHVPVRMTVVVEGDEMTIDFSEVAPQVAGAYNSGATAGRSAAQVAFKCLTTPTLRPINDGALRPLKIVLPSGTFVSAERPAPMRRWMAYPMTVVDVIWKALAPAAPELVIAGNHDDLVSLRGGGWGAKLGEDGMSATIAINDGDTHNTPVEAQEAKFPYQIVTRHELRQDSGGAGEWRGGLGVAIETRMREGMDAYTLARLRVANSGGMTGWVDVERTQCAPWGLFGGKDGLPNKVERANADGSYTELPGKGSVGFLDTYEGVVMSSGGGGGFGDPLRRPVEKVLADVVAGYVSARSAREDYGVVVTGEDEDGYVLDPPSTEALRAYLAETTHNATEEKS